MSARKRKHPTDDEDQSRNEDEDMEWEDEEGMHVDGIYIPPPIKPVTAHTFATRLLITKITNRFFKSYANEVVLGPFGKCFNAIVGPNGSGKSNVIDSMLFVFGYRAAKIRSKKLSVLLHNSEKYKNVQSCTVCVHFCEIIDRAGDDYDIVPGSEFTVSRTANKDNSSFYELNNRKVQFKEVAQLLRKHGIDLDHNRFLILQGEVEEIAMMKCKGATENETGMLEYLEDVIGTSRYKVPLNQLCERIETLSALRSEKLNRVKLIQKELDELKEPMEEAIVFLKTENKAMSCKNFIYQHKIFNLGNKSKELEAEKATVAESLNELNQRLDDVKKQKAEKERILEEESKKYHKLQTRKNKLKEAYENAIKKDDQLQADMTQLIKKRKKCKSQLEEEKNKLEQFRRAPEENQQKIVEYEAKESELKTKKETLETERTALLASVREETLDLQTAKEKYETQLQQLRKNVDETKRAFVLAENELNLAVSKENTEKTKLEQIRESIAQAEETVEVKTKEVAALRKKIPLTEKSLRDAQDEVNGVKREQAQLITDLRKKKLSLEDSKSSMQMMKSRSRVLDALMEQKRKGNCDGLFGRLCRPKRGVLKLETPLKIYEQIVPYYLQVVFLEV